MKQVQRKSGVKPRGGRFDGKKIIENNMVLRTPGAITSEAHGWLAGQIWKSSISRAKKSNVPPGLSRLKPAGVEKMSKKWEVCVIWYFLQK